MDDGGGGGVKSMKSMHINYTMNKRNLKTAQVQTVTARCPQLFKISLEINDTWLVEVRMYRQQTLP
jgi:hypothetical protein